MTGARGLAWLPWYPGDYVAATRGMTLAERGAYTDLLWFQWETGPLPREHGRLARLLGVSDREFAKVWPAVGAKFTETDAGLVNERLEVHRADCVRRQGAHRAGAALTNAKRRQATLSATLSDTLSASPSATPSEPLSGSPPHPQKIPRASLSAANAGSGEPEVAPPPDPKAELWRVGVRLLTESGKTQANARSLIGRWIRDHDEATVGAVIGEAASKADPVGWITKALEHRRATATSDARFAVRLDGDPA